MAKTALLFPGLDALFLASKLTRWLHNPSAIAGLSESSGYLSQLTGQNEDLADFLAREARPHLADFDRTLVALSALQIGIARALHGSGQTWDVVVGCSHGDIGRSVLCESLSFKSSVEILWSFAELRKSCPEGCTANVRTTDGSPLKPAHIQWLNDQKVPVSTWSENNATIAGPSEQIQSLAALSREYGLKIKPVLPYPVHSPTMGPSAEVMRTQAPRWNIAPPCWPVFSSVWVRYLQTPDDIRTEGLEGSVSPVRWVETLETLVQKEGVRRFLNVGPSNTLTQWAFSSPRLKGVDIQDGWDLLHPKEDACSSM